MIFRSKSLVLQIFHRYHGTITMKIALLFHFGLLLICLLIDPCFLM